MSIVLPAAYQNLLSDYIRAAIFKECLAFSASHCALQVYNI